MCMYIHIYIYIYIYARTSRRKYRTFCRAVTSLGAACTALVTPPGWPFGMSTSISVSVSISIRISINIRISVSISISIIMIIIIIMIVCLPDWAEESKGSVVEGADGLIGPCRGLRF